MTTEATNHEAVPPIRRKTLFKWLAFFTGIAGAVLAAEIGLRILYYHRVYPYELALQRGVTRLLDEVRGNWLSGLPRYSGLELNRVAYAATYEERGLPVPPLGPREGFWGARVNPKNVNCGPLRLCERAQVIPGLVAIDTDGFQFAGQRNNPFPHILIIGGSVAFGAFASSIENTYFSLLSRSLSEEFPNVKVSVFGVGASKSDDDVSAFAIKGLPTKPDVVVFLNGLNDLVNPPEGNLHERVVVYLRNMRLAQEIALARQVVVVFALQPFLGGKKIKSPLERRILQLSWSTDYETTVNPRYAEMAEGLRRLVAPVSDEYFIDLSGQFDREAATTFADQWHFSDPGHQLLADGLASHLVPILRGLKVR